MKMESCRGMWINTETAASDFLFQYRFITISQLLAPMEMKESLSSTLKDSAPSNRYVINKDFGFGIYSTSTNIFEDHCFRNNGFRMNGFACDENQIFITAKREEKETIHYYIYSNKNMFRKNTDNYSNKFPTDKKERQSDFIVNCSGLNGIKSEIVKTKTISNADTISETKSFCAEKTRKHIENITKIERWNLSDISGNVKLLHDFGLKKKVKDKIIYLPCSVFMGDMYRKDISCGLKSDYPNWK
jgi:hypothetical protein